MEDTAAANDEFVKVVSIGQSYEGREMNVIEIRKAGEGKPNVWIEAGMVVIDVIQHLYVFNTDEKRIICLLYSLYHKLGIHAREWIADSIATYLINELTKPNRDNDIIDHLNIHVLPMANPDGYEFSRNSDRLWRKTRSETNSSLGCMGVDGNRNWDFHWGGISS